MALGFGQAFGGGFTAGIRSGQLSKQMAAAEQARQDQLGFQQRAEERAERAEARAGQLHSLALQERRAALAQNQRARQRQLDFQSDAAQVLGTGNYSELLMKYPERAADLLELQQTQTQIKQMEAGGMNVRRAAGQAFNAVARGDLEGARQVINANRQIIEGGGDPSFTVDRALELLDTNPGELAEMMRGVYQMAGGSPDALVGVRQPLTSYQEAQIRLEEEKINIDREQAALQAKQRELAAATTQAQREKLTKEMQLLDQRIEEGKKAQREAQASKQNAVDSMQDAVDLAKELAESPNLSAITGTIDPRLPTLSGANQDLVNKAKRLQSLLTVDKLGLMTGVLTDRDIQFLTNVASGLQVTDNGILGSTEGVQQNLADIVNRMNEAIDRAQREGKLQGLEGQTGTGSGTTDAGLTWKRLE